MADDITDQITNVANINLQQVVGDYFPYVLYSIIGALILFLVIRYIRNKLVFKWKVRIFRRRENGKVKELNNKGGYLRDKKGIPFFRIKLGRLPWQKLDTYTLPNANYIDEEDRIYYNQLDPFTIVQVKRTFLAKKVPSVDVKLLKDYQEFKKGTVGHLQTDAAKVLAEKGIAEILGDAEVEVDDAILEPVPNDLKAITVNELQQVRDVLRTDTTKQVAIIVGGIIILAIIFLGAYYLLTNA